MSAWTRFKEAIGGPRILYEETLEEAARAHEVARRASTAAHAVPPLADPFVVAKDGGITIVVESVDDASLETLDDARQAVAQDLNALADRLSKTGVRLRSVGNVIVTDPTRPPRH